MKNSIKYVYNWKNNEKRAKMKGRACIVIARGKKNSVQIEFTDTSQREIVSRNSVSAMGDLYQLTTTYACAGVTVDENHEIVDAAPIYKWMIGKKARFVINYLKRQAKYEKMHAVIK